MSAAAHAITNPYHANGYRDRNAYLAALADEYESGMVYLYADLLGPSEDFDGLVTALEDCAL